MSYGFPGGAQRIILFRFGGKFVKVIVIGAGDVGYHIASRMVREGNDVVVIEKDEVRLRHIAESLDVQPFLGSGASPSILQQAGIASAEMIIAVTNSDEVNMMACLIADSQSHVPTKIARIREEEYVTHANILDKQHLDIDLVINPEQEAVMYILRLLDAPGGTDLVHLFRGRLWLVGLAVDEKSPLVGKRMAEIPKLGRQADFLVAAIARYNRIIIPKGSDKIEAKDILYVVTLPNQIKNVYRVLSKNFSETRRVIIYGGGNIGLNLAKALEKRRVSMKIIEESEERCNQLAEILDRTVVIHGSGANEELLKEENVQDVDEFIAVSSDEEANVLVSLLSKQLGARRVMTVLNKLSYFKLVQAIGVDVIVSPRLAAVGSILQYLRHGKVLSVTPVRKEEAEVIEIIALETSDLINRPLREIRFPDGAIVGAVWNNERVIVPDGNTVIKPGDRVIIFALTSAVPQIEKLLTVKMGYF